MCKRLKQVKHSIIINVMNSLSTLVSRCYDSNLIPCTLNNVINMYRYSQCSPENDDDVFFKSKFSGIAAHNIFLCMGKKKS